MSAIFQRPLCEMGKAYDFALRPLLGDPEPGSGGPCDDHPRPVELWEAHAEPASPSAAFRKFSLCPEHESQLRRFDQRSPRGSRFRSPPAAASPAPRR